MCRILRILQGGLREFLIAGAELPLLRRRGGDELKLRGGGLRVKSGSFAAALKMANRCSQGLGGYFPALGQGGDAIGGSVRQRLDGHGGLAAAGGHQAAAVT